MLLLRQLLRRLLPLLLRPMLQLLERLLPLQLGLRLRCTHCLWLFLGLASSVAPLRLLLRLLPLHLRAPERTGPW